MLLCFRGHNSIQFNRHQEHSFAFDPIAFCSSDPSDCALIALFTGLFPVAKMSLLPYDPRDWSMTATPWGSWGYDRGSLVGQPTTNEAVRPLAPLMSADLVEAENDFHIHVDLPGVENLDISVDNNMLTITADRKVSRESDTDITHRVERSYGKVRRSLLIPYNADADRATAKFKDGVLTVTLPKKEGTEAKGKKLTITS